MYCVEDVNNFAKHEELTVLINVGSLLFDPKVDYHFLTLNLHLNENYLATIISLIDVNNIPVVRVTMDASIKKAMNVVLRYVTVFKFK